MWQPLQESEEPKTNSSEGWAMRNFQCYMFQTKAKLSVGFESEKLNWKSSKRPKSVFPQCWSRTARLRFAYQTKTAWVLPVVMVLTWKSSIILLLWPKKKSLQLRYSWGWSIVRLCDIMLYWLRSATRARGTQMTQAASMSNRSQYCTISHDGIADQPQEYLGCKVYYFWPGY